MLKAKFNTEWAAHQTKFPKGMDSRQGHFTFKNELCHHLYKEASDEVKAHIEEHCQLMKTKLSDEDDEPVGFQRYDYVLLTFKALN